MDNLREGQRVRVIPLATRDLWGKEGVITSVRLLPDKVVAHLGETPMEVRRCTLQLDDEDRERQMLVSQLEVI